MLAALRQRNFALLWSGGLVSRIGGLTLSVALPFYVYVLSGSALATGAMFLAELLQRGTADAYRGRVFGALGTWNALAMLLGILGAGVTGDHLGPAVLLGVAGMLYVSAGLVALALPQPGVAARPAAVELTSG